MRSMNHECHRNIARETKKQKNFKLFSCGLVRKNCANVDLMVIFLCPFDKEKRRQYGSKTFFGNDHDELFGYPVANVKIPGCPRAQTKKKNGLAA